MAKRTLIEVEEVREGEGFDGESEAQFEVREYWGITEITLHRESEKVIVNVSPEATIQLIQELLKTVRKHLEVGVIE